MPEPPVDPGEVAVYRLDAGGRLVSERRSRSALARVRLAQRRRYGRPPDEGNLVVRGDCLLGLTALRERLAGRVQLVYADPPYNTGRRGRRYDDALDRALWLDMLRERLIACRALLRRRGWLFLHLDATRLGEAQGLCDEVFGRESFAHLITWERMPPAMTFLGQGAAELVTSTEFLLVYARDRRAARLQRQQREVEATARVLEQYALEVRPGRRQRVAEEPGPGGRPLRIYEYPRAVVRRVPRAERLACFDRLHQSTRVPPDSTLQRRLLDRLDPDVLHAVTYTPTRGKRAGRRITVLLHRGRQLWPARENAHVRDGRVWRRADLTTLWTNQEISAVGTAPEGGVKLVRGKKPEALLARVLALATRPGDLVLDPFAGSGTTAAVALKLGRRFVTCEISAHADELVVPRLRRVIGGEDASGMTREAGWTGGSGFRLLEAVSP